MSHPPIICRRITLDFEADRARGWHPTRGHTEDLLNALSFMFPNGERFFIRCVQHYQNHITDPVLAEQVRLFLYQEAMHSKEHVRCNAALATVFPRGPAIDRFTAKVLNFTRFYSWPFRLALTCALEHMTAMLADSLLSSQEQFLEATDYDFASLWLWHAVEETEHKAVAFDVYVHIFGRGIWSTLRRGLAMALVSVDFVLVAIIAIFMIKRDGKAAPVGDNKRRGSYQLLHEILAVKQYWPYYRRSFHPWDHDNSALVAAWKQRYQDFGRDETEVVQSLRKAAS